MEPKLNVAINNFPVVVLIVGGLLVIILLMIVISRLNRIVDALEETETRREVSTVFEKSTWTCPQCKNENPNETFTCKSCDYSLK